MNINLMAPINQLGYGITGLNVLKALFNDGHDVSLSVIGNQPQVTNQKDADIVSKAAKRLFFHDAPCIKIWHQNDLSMFVGRGEHVGFPIFELDTFTDIERHHLQYCNRLFVCSKWAKNVCVANGVQSPDDISVIPLGVDTSIFQPAEPVKKDKIIFFNCGKWEVRKGHDILIHAFKKVAEKHDNIELWMMCENPFNSPKENAMWHELYKHPKVKLIRRAETQQEVYNIMSQVDCGIFPSRGEGWNLELLEMMAAGKHIIATDYSAHTQFCTKQNSRLVPIIDKEPAFDNKWFFGQGEWAKIDSETIITLEILMEDFIYEYDWEINQNGVETAKKFSWENTSKEIASCLN